MNATRTAPNRDSRPPNADAPPPAAPAAPPPATPGTDAGQLRDGWMRALGIPFFGLVIPRVTGLLGQLEWHEPLYWAGTLWFVATAALVWEGNRWLLFKQRSHVDWFQRPVLKLLLLIAANIVYTTPVTIASCWLWLRWLGAPFPALNWAQINLATACVVVAVVFVTHAYETVFLIKERRDDQLRLEREARARVEAELETMKAQLAPHFLFNCLNTLAALIEREPANAAAFNQHLADVCRYLLLQKNRDLVPLAEELEFFRSYAELTRLRFPRSIVVTLTGFDAATAARHRIPPASLQLLLENAIKHNQFDEANPLPVTIAFADGAIVVTNPLRPKTWRAPSTGIGLHNLRERVQLTTGGTLQVTPAGGLFHVRLPVVTT